MPRARKTPREKASALSALRLHEAITFLSEKEALAYMKKENIFWQFVVRKVGAEAYRLQPDNRD